MQNNMIVRVTKKVFWPIFWIVFVIIFIYVAKAIMQSFLPSTPSAKQETPPIAAIEPTATTADMPLPQPTADSGVPVQGIVESLDMSTVIAEVLSSPKLMGCITGSVGMSTAMQFTQRQPTEAEIAQIMHCFSDEQLSAWTGTAAAQPVASDATADIPLPLPTDTQPASQPAPTADSATPVQGIFESLDMSTVMTEVMSSPELMGCITDSVGMSTVMQFTQRPPTEAEIAQIMHCFSVEQLSAWSGMAAAQPATGDAIASKPAATAAPSPTPEPTPTAVPRATAVQDLPDGWDQEVIYDHPIVYPSTLTIDGDGSVLVASRGNGKILRMAPDGTLTTIADVSGLPEVSALAHQPGHARVLLTTMMTGLYALSNGELSRLQPWGVMANSLSVDPSNGSFYGCSMSRAPDAGIVYFDADGNIIDRIVDTTDGCFQTALDADNGMLYYSETFPGTITAVDLSDGSKEVIAEGIGIPGTYEPIGVALDGNGVLHSFPNAHGLFRYEDGSFELVMESIAGAGMIVWSPDHDAFLVANGVGSNIIAYDPEVRTATHLTPYVNAIAITGTTSGTVLVCDGNYLGGHVLSVDAAGMHPFTEDLGNNCRHLERDGHGTVRAGMTDGSIWTIGEDGSASVWLGSVSGLPITCLQYDAKNDALVAVMGDNDRSVAEFWRIPVDTPGHREKVTELTGVGVDRMLTTCAVDGDGNIYVLDRQKNVIHLVADGEDGATVFADSVLESEAITVPRMEYLSTEDALLVSTIDTYDLWPLDGSGRSVFARNAGGVDNFAISEGPDGDILAVHSGRVFRLIRNR